MDRQASEVMTHFLMGVAVGMALIPFVRAVVTTRHYQQPLRLDVESQERRGMMLDAGREP